MKKLLLVFLAILLALCLASCQSKTQSVSNEKETDVTEEDEHGAQFEGSSHMFYFDKITEIINDKETVVTMSEPDETERIILEMGESLDSDKAMKFRAGLSGISDNPTYILDISGEPNTSGTINITYWTKDDERIDDVVDVTLDSSGKKQIKVMIDMNKNTMEFIKI
ncbi:MAG: hypothetical protein SNJ70_04910 [Armatimonadota bacterium]